MAKITSLTARQILDAKGNPTVEVELTLDSGQTVTSSCPSGTSTGKYEAHELRDLDSESYGGKGVLKAVNNINAKISPALIGKDPSFQKDIDNILISLDGTKNKEMLGSNSILTTSLAVAKAGAKASNVPLYRYIASLAIVTEKKMPTPIFNVINGGLHASTTLSFQEFQIIPVSMHKFSDKLTSGVEITNSLRKVLLDKEFPTLVGDEGGFAPNLKTNDEAFELIRQAVTSINQTLGQDIFTGLDAAASSFFVNGEYKVTGINKELSSSELAEYYKALVQKYSLLYLEDPFAEDDWQAWTTLTDQTTDKLIVTGDDLTATNSLRLDEAIEKKAIRGIIIKPNQIGTVTETLDVVNRAKKAGLKIIVSHRSGETNDDFIADFAVGVGADYAKFGAPVRGERVAKYNRLLQIEDELFANH